MRITKTAIEILVLDYRQEILDDAKVILSPLGKKRKKIDLKFDKKIRAYRSSKIFPGNYVIHVGKKGLEIDKRQVTIGPAKYKTKFILGKKGMPSYHLGAIKVPFEPKNDLIGVSLKPNRSFLEDKKFLKFVKGLKLELENLNERISGDNIRVFRFPSKINQKSKVRISDALSKHKTVKLAGPILQLNDDKVSFMTNQLIVKFKQNINRKEIEGICKKLGMKLIRHISYAGNSFLIQKQILPSYGLLEVCSKFFYMKNVEYAEPNVVTSTEDFEINPTDFLFPQQWNLQRANLLEAWQHLHDSTDPLGSITFGSEDVIIGIMDNGIESQTVGGITRAAHPDFDGTVAGGENKVYKFFNFATMEENNDTPANHHGNAVAGISAALANNASVVPGEDEGISGAAPNCRLMGLIKPSPETQIKFADAYIWAAGYDPGWVADGINYDLGTVFPEPINPGMDISSNSFRIPEGSLMEDTFDFLTTFGRNGKGILVFAAAGNSDIYVTEDHPMATYEKIIAVAASTNADDKAPVSSYGNEIEICAPSKGGGFAITSCSLHGMGNTAGHTGGDLDYISGFGGTSSATALSAGVAALIISANPDLTWIEARQILRNTAEQIDFENTDPVGRWISRDGVPFSQWYGYGRIDAARAVQEALTQAGMDPLRLADTWIKENTADLGDIPSLPPFSPDVWVRNTNPAMDIPTEIHNHQKPIRGQDNWVYATVRNRGDIDSSDVYVRIYITRWAGTQYVYPDDFIPTVPPSSDPITPFSPGTYLIGEIHISSIPSHDEVTVNTRWPRNLIPPESVTIEGVEYSWADSCLLVDVSPHDGPRPTGNHTWDNNNLCQRNISIINPEVSDEMSFAFVAGNPKNEAEILNLKIVRKNLPYNVKLLVDYVDNNTIKKALKIFNKKNVIRHNKKGKPLFGLPLHRETNVRLPRESNKCQLVALHLTGLKKLKKGKYQIDIFQQDTKGKIEGSVNLLIFKK